MLYKVVCLDDQRCYGFMCNSAYRAMMCMKYMLDLSHKDPGAIINKTETGLHLYMTHSGKTYCVRI